MSINNDGFFKIFIYFFLNIFTDYPRPQRATTGHMGLSIEAMDWLLSI